MNVSEFVAERSKAGALVQLIVDDYPHLPCAAVNLGRGETCIAGGEGPEVDLDCIAAGVVEKANEVVGIPLADGGGQVFQVLGERRTVSRIQVINAHNRVHGREDQDW